MIRDNVILFIVVCLVSGLLGYAILETVDQKLDESIRRTHESKLREGVR